MGTATKLALLEASSKSHLSEGVRKKLEGSRSRNPTLLASTLLKNEYTAPLATGAPAEKSQGVTEIRGFLLACTVLHVSLGTCMSHACSSELLVRLEAKFLLSRNQQTCMKDKYRLICVCVYIYVHMNDGCVFVYTHELYI